MDLTDESIGGGTLTKCLAGVNWWPNRRIRICAGHGRASLGKTGTTGHTNHYFARLQWVHCTRQESITCSR